MATQLPYIVQPGAITRIITKLIAAKTPERFTQDFLATKLGFKGGNYNQFIPLAKKLGLLNSDGTTTDLYKKLRNPQTLKASMAAAMRIGYRDLFERNEYAGSLKKEDFKGLVVEITGLEATSRIVQLICQTFETLKAFADFDATLQGSSEPTPEEKSRDGAGDQTDATKGHHDLKLGLSYSINLVLPKTDDPAVFNAIFKALRDNLLNH